MCESNVSICIYTSLPLPHLHVFPHFFPLSSIFSPSSHSFQPSFLPVKMLQESKDVASFLSKLQQMLVHVGLNHIPLVLLLSLLLSAVVLGSYAALPSRDATPSSPATGPLPPTADSAAADWLAESGPRQSRLCGHQDTITVSEIPSITASIFFTYLQ